MNEIKKIIDASKLKIKKEGYKAYFGAVKDKIQKRKISKITSFSEKQENILEKKMVWVFGSPRSGTTWFCSQLLNHPENIIWYEPDIGIHLAVMADNKITKNNEPTFERIYDEHGKRDAYFFSEKHKENWMPALRKLILIRAFSEAQTVDKNLIIKEPVGAQASEIIMECFPNSKLIFLVRDGRDVVDSRMDMHGKDTWAKLQPLKSEQDRKRKIRWYSFQWKQIMERMNLAYQQHQPSLRFLIKYEDLRKDTFSVLKKVYEFLNIKINDQELKNIVHTYNFENIDDSLKGKGKFFRKATPGSWKNNFFNFIHVYLFHLIVQSNFLVSQDNWLILKNFKNSYKVTKFLKSFSHY